MTRAAKRAIGRAIVAATLVIGTACAHEHPATRPLTTPTPTLADETDFPTPPAVSLSFSPVPTTVGETVVCGDLPMPGSLIAQWNGGPCWGVRQRTDGIFERFWAGGNDLDHPTIGVLVWGGFGADEKDDHVYTEHLNGHGRLLVTLGRFGYACIRAKDGSRWVFTASTRHFTRPTGSPKCPA